MEFLEKDGPFSVFKAINKALKDNPWIRCRRPLTKDGREHPRRREIHAGDWTRFKAGQAPDPLDQPAETVDAVVEAAGRQEEIRRRKGERGK
jgi:hypothetical protein